MKKLFWFAVATMTALSLFVSCKDKKEEDVPDVKTVATLAQAELINAAADAYAAWEDDNTIPGDLTVGSVKLTLPQYQEALAKLMVALAASDKSDIKVMGYKAADHPDRDSYDQKEIAVTGGAKINEGTEDLADLAKRFVAATEEKLTIPNQTLVTRTGASALAFSTNRLTVTLLRAIAAYKSGSALPKTVSTDYLSAAATLKGFAQQFVGILDIWEKTVGTVSADGSHCTDNNSAWKDVHFVPIPWSGGAYADGVDQYDAQYQPYFTITIDGKTYDSAQTWGVALRGIMNLLTKEGAATMQQERNTFIHTMGNGGSLKDPIPAVDELDIWGQYPWYESTNDGPAINLATFSPYLIVRTAAWFLTRQQALGKIGNYQLYTVNDPDNGFVEEGVVGFVSAMRMWLIAARFYKYLLDNNITDNVYDAVKDVQFATDLYGVDLPDIELVTKRVDVPSAGTAMTAKINAKEAWTATASESWIHVEPEKGEAGIGVSLSISADPNTGAEREGKVIVKGGNVTEGLEITVVQGKYVDPSSVTLKEFAEEFVKGLDVWEATVGTVESEGYHLIEKGTAWENVHFIPIGKTGGPYDSHAGNQHDDMYTPWTMQVGETNYTSAQAWEIAVRGLLDLVLTEGQGYVDIMTSRNKPGYTFGDNGSLSGTMTAVPSEKAKWGNYPWYEAGDDYKGLFYNDAPVKEVGIDLITKAIVGHLVRGLVGIPGVFDALGNIGNFQVFGTDDSTLMLDGYAGYIAPMRELIVMMRVYKYLLDNNIDSNVYTAIKDVKFDYDMYHQGDAPVQQVATIEEFAKEFAKVATTWENSVGTVAYSYDGNNYSYTDVHYVPESYTITLKGKTYDKHQMQEIALNAFKTLENGGTLTDEITAPGSYTPASARWHEYGDGLKESVAKTDLLSNFATRCLNYLKNNGEWPNVCGYPRTSDPVLTSYNGYVCVERDLLMMARWFKYVVDNNITSNVVEATKDVEIATDLYTKTEAAATILDFAKEYVKIIDVWQKTTGPVTMYKDSEVDYTVENAHYVPDNTTITVGGKTYNVADMWETALRSYLLVRGYDGLDTEHYGKNSIAALDGGAVSMSKTTVPDTHDYYFGSWPYNETPGNGGHLVMGSDANGEHCKVKVDILDNWAMRSLNFQKGQSITNLCGYAGGQLDGYYGCFSSKRALITYAFFFKYMLDNNLDKGTEVSDNAIIRSELLGDEEATVPTIKDFAKEYVKILDVWEKTTGPVTMYKDSEVDYTVENAHYVPDNTTITVGTKTYNVADMWETALRSYLLVRGYDGLDTEHYGKNSIAALDGGAVSMSKTAVPDTHDYYFGSWPYNETPGNGGHLVMGSDASGEHCKVKLDILDNWAMRSLNFQKGQTITNLCGYAGGQLDGYYGCFCSKRGLLTYAFFFKYMLDNNLDKADAIAASTIIRSELFGDE